jgi:isoleucyl-tRNA synthetase
MQDSTQNKIEKVNFAKIEQNIMQYWQENRTFELSVEIRPQITSEGTNNQYVFFDGPPFANGLPHYGHLLTGFVKDIFARYHTMLGKKVDRKFGWDCHGLPAEMEAEKTLKITGRLAIKEYGIDQFNNHCQTSVLRYTQEWKDYVFRQARWVDFDGGYKTMDTDYMESVLWAFSELHKKDMLYEDTRVVPYSWKCQTPLSNFETRLDNSYHRKESKSVTVKFELEDVPQFVKDEYPNTNKVFLLAWTTTPWTLPSNLAVAVGEDIQYAMIEKNNMIYIIAKDLVGTINYDAL